MFQAGREAVKLTDEQKSKLSALRGQLGPAPKELREKIAAILTPEQKEQLKKKIESWQKDRPRPAAASSELSPRQCSPFDVTR